MEMQEFIKKDEKDLEKNKKMMKYLREGNSHAAYAN